MRLELGTVEARAAVRPATGPPPRRTWPRPDRFELGVLGAFAAVSVWVLALDLWQVLANGRVWTGTDGLFIVDQLQYLAWIRSASQHVLVANLFVLRSTPADYFQPAVAISGGLAALGLAPWVSLLLWKPIAVVAAFFATRAFVDRMLPGLWARRAALVLALFFGSFTVFYGALGIIGDLWPGFLSWGYEFGLIALAAMLAGVLAYDRARLTGQRLWLAGALGALAGLLHPWNGEIFILVVVLAEVVLRGRRRWSRDALRLPVLSVSLAVLPLLYYAALGRSDLSWKLAREASRHSFSLWSILLAILPLTIPAVIAYRQPPRDFLGAVTRAWLPAALIIFAVSASGVSATPLHAFQGITIPLAVLAVQGILAVNWSRVRWRRAIAVAAVALFTIPATINQLHTAIGLAAPTVDNANFIQPDERTAIDYLSDAPGGGGVLTRSYLGALIPGRTGRRTLIGDCLWSEPDCYDRSRTAQALFDGSLRGPAALRFVRRSGARFVLADCATTAPLRRELAPLILGVHRFGCATVFELAHPGLPSGPLAQSRAHAPLRAARRQHRPG